MVKRGVRGGCVNEKFTPQIRTKIKTKRKTKTGKCLVNFPSEEVLIRQ